MSYLKQYMILLASPNTPRIANRTYTVSKHLHHSWLKLKSPITWRLCWSVGKIMTLDISYMLCILVCGMGTCTWYPTLKEMWYKGSRLNWIGIRVWYPWDHFRVISKRFLYYSCTKWKKQTFSHNVSLGNRK